MANHSIGVGMGGKNIVLISTVHGERLHVTPLGRVSWQRESGRAPHWHKVFLPYDVSHSQWFALLTRSCVF